MLSSITVFLRQDLSEGMLCVWADEDWAEVWGVFHLLTFHSLSAFLFHQGTAFTSCTAGSGITT